MGDVLAAMHIHVVAGLMLDDCGRVLVARRPPGKPMAGAWEFPGGKLSAGESRLEGLSRELKEELGIDIGSARPLIRYRHRYPEFSVDLDCWRVTDWRGDPESREGQLLAWHRSEELLDVGLLPADIPVVKALTLPHSIAVTPPLSRDKEGLLDALRSCASTLICLRRPDLPANELTQLATRAVRELQDSGKRVLLHGDPAAFEPLIRDASAGWNPRRAGVIAGLHVPARYLPGLAEGAVRAPLLLGVSCHDALELEAALAVNADYAFLGPVKPTASHPGEPALGWANFSELVRQLPLPVYAIGGLGPDDLEAAWDAGAQGVAGIRAFWPA